MKFLTDQQYNELKEKSDAYSQIVTAIIGNSEGVEAKDITAEHIIEALQAEGKDAKTVDLQPQLDLANARITELEGELETSNSKVAELEEELDAKPAEESAKITSKGETTGEKKDLIDFAKENQKNPFAVIEQAKKEGLI
ncbi:hypothetical protein [Proteiniphilum propionicum]|jgi:hypothetical protein|uniref:hypothetical protein n=1 Tax=Proteiniphilum propionicum TaxID=2829812 RepID=UPI001EEB53C3|nr:hypothetical protein [Proteiniphilum propionicum]MDD4009262.1 hypothetical protein [Fermentimonas sp.]MDD4437796.1 hypothetical protein [Tissierellia bacterium]ULB35927.1 hypothetical protein KDN43_07920 [Proteiniphilum propionicum]